MSRTITLLTLVALPWLMQSCAGNYHVIAPEHENYNAIPHQTQEVTLGYRYNVLAEHSNRKFAKKEDKNHVQLVAVVLTNHTDQPLVLGQDFNLINNGQVAHPLPTDMTYRELKQKSGLFFLYLLGSFMNISTTTTNQYGVVETQSVFPIGLILGPGLALGNYAVAQGNNRDFKQELEIYDLHGRVIQPGETVYGLIGLAYSKYGPLSVRMENQLSSN